MFYAVQCHRVQEPEAPPLARYKDLAKYFAFSKIECEYIVHQLADVSDSQLKE